MRPARTIRVSCGCVVLRDRTRFAFSAPLEKHPAHRRIRPAIQHGALHRHWFAARRVQTDVGVSQQPARDRNAACDRLTLPFAARSDVREIDKDRDQKRRAGQCQRSGSDPGMMCNFDQNTTQLHRDPASINESLLHVVVGFSANSTRGLCKDSHWDCVAIGISR
jgi:hypothetical protein